MLIERMQDLPFLPLCFFVNFCYNLMTSCTLKMNIDIDYLRHKKRNKVRSLAPLRLCCLSFQTHLITAFYSGKTDDVVEALNQDSGELAQAQTCREYGGWVTSSFLLFLLSLLPFFSLSTLWSGRYHPLASFWSIYVLPRSEVRHGLWGMKKSLFGLKNLHAYFLNRRL